ncbi:MAG: glycosyltransferase [Desulfuromonadales bacterium]|nr:glycosyltransferase [Desulfuromonadales bacterium]
MYHKIEKDIMRNWEGDLSTPIVNIICITYNHEAYISDAIDGFLMQETDFPFQVIVHDDFSTDGTANIVEEYAKKYPNIIKPIIRSENQYSKRGYSFIDELYKIANGEFVALCEGDDYWIDPLKIQKQTSILRKNKNYSMSIHNSFIRYGHISEESLFNRKKLPSELRIRDVLLRRWFSPTASFFLRNNNLIFPEVKDVNGDMLTLLHASLQGVIHYSDDPMSVYRYLSNGSMSALAIGDLLPLYRKKINFLDYADRLTSSKYIYYTTAARLKTHLASYAYVVKRYIVSVFP